MGKQHDTIPNEPQEAPVGPQRPEVQQPTDPRGPGIPPEAPQNEPEKVPQRKPDQPGFLLNKTEI